MQNYVTKAVEYKPPPPLHSAAARRGAQADIAIEVGPDRTKYHIQRAFLIHHSEYFRKALCGAWTEAKDGVVSLIDIEPAVFNLYVEWLYTQHIPTNDSEYMYITSVLGITKDMWKIKLYIFADRFAVPVLRTAMNRQIVNDSDSNSSKVWIYATIIYAFSNLPPKGPLMDLFVDRYYMGWTGKMTSTTPLPHDFLLRFFNRVGKERSSRYAVALNVFNMDLCSYYEHDTDAEKVNCSQKSRSFP